MIKYVAEVQRHLQTGIHKWAKTVNGELKVIREMPLADRIEIVIKKNENEPCYIYRYTKDGEFCGDTWHDSFQQALEEAEHEYGLKITDFSKIEFKEHHPIIQRFKSTYIPRIIRTLVLLKNHPKINKYRSHKSAPIEIIKCDNCGTENFVSSCIICNRYFILTESHLKGKFREYESKPVISLPDNFTVTKCDFCIAEGTGNTFAAVKAGLSQRTCPICHESHLPVKKE